MAFHETHKRTLVKTITWRVIATITTVVIIYAYTKNVSIALASGLVANALKTIFYYVHERVWNRIKFGRVHKK